MLKYCKVVDENTKEVSIGLGNNINFYKSIGFEEKEVIEVNNRYYLKGYEPEIDLNEIKENEKQKKKQELKNNLEKTFYERYPLHKQCNIAIYGTDEERKIFKDFHDQLVKDYDEEILKLDNQN